MAELTVGVPAYRAAPFIARTLASIQEQSFSDFVVYVGVEPVDPDATLAACAPFLDDPRFRVTVNDTVLGWDGNVRALYRRVATPYGVVIPHDDAWHPRYLERLMDALRERPDAVCAYSDLYRFGRGSDPIGVVSSPLPDADLPARLLEWFLGGAEGTPWHGVIRREVLELEFPTDAHGGFAVECEWVLHLMSRGVLLHVPEPLYLKRVPGHDHSVSLARLADVSGLPAALAHHRERLLEGLPEVLPNRDVVIAAAEAAVLRRWSVFVGERTPLPPGVIERADRLLKSTDRLPTAVAHRIVAVVRWVLARDRMAAGDAAGAEQELRRGLAASPDDAALGTRLGWLLLGRGDLFGALDIALRASAGHPNTPGLRRLLAACDEGLEKRLAPTAPA